MFTLWVVIVVFPNAHTHMYLPSFFEGLGGCHDSNWPHDMIYPYTKYTYLKWAQICVSFTQQLRDNKDRPHPWQDKAPFLCIVQTLGVISE